jgi:hypothetical protein
MILTGIASDRSVELAPAAASPAAGGSFLDQVAQGYMVSAQIERDKARAVTDTLAQGASLAPVAYRQTSLVDLTNSRSLAVQESYDGIIDTVKRSTGVQLENPERGGYTAAARRMAQDQVTALSRDDAADAETGGLPTFRRQAFDAELRKVIEARPDARDALAAARIDYAPEMIARRAQLDLEARSADMNLGGQLIGGLAGGLAASFRDPVQVAGLLLGGGPGTARLAAARIGQVALREAALNAGLVAVSQPSVQAWRNQVGLENGVVPALENVGMAALFGGVIGGGLAAGGELFRSAKPLATADRDAVLAVLRGEASVDQVERAIAVTGVTPTPEIKAELAALRQAEAADAATLKAPANVAPEAHVAAVHDAVSHAEAPSRAPPPEPPLPAPRPAAAQPSLADDAPAPVALGRTFNVLDKPVTFQSIGAGDLTTDAAVMQYKGGGDAAGVTDRLRSVGRWDPLASGKAVVFERLDGTLVVADGHQRLGLAKRMMEDGQADVRLDAYVFREADGWTPQDVRAVAAKKNIQEGSGDVLDTARILRERPDLYDASLPVGDIKVRQGRAIARLSDEAWGMTLNGVVPPNYAAHVGMVPDPALHAGIMQDLVRAEPANENAARFVVADSLASGTRLEVQENLFGLQETTRTLFAERTKVFGEAAKILKRERAAFGTLLANAEIVERAGNVIDRDASSKAVSSAELVSGLVEKLATRAGPVSDALNRAAAAMAEGAPREKVARTFLADVLDIFERDGLAGLEAQPRLAPDTAIEPGSAEAKAQADTLTMDMFGAAPATERTAAGDQTLIPGVAPVTDRQRAEVAAAKPMTGGDAAPPAGGLFDDGARAQTDLMDMLPMQQGENGAIILRRDQAMAEVERADMFGDLVASCTS